MFTRTLFILLVTFFSANEAFASAEEDAQVTAESQRLTREMVALASRNAWQGVERTYQKLVSSHTPISATTYILAGNTAVALGDTWEAYQRYFRALQLDETVSAGQHLRQIRNNFGRVEILRKNRSSAQLTPEKNSFQPDVRKSIEHAAQQLDQTGGFSGMLPVGTYDINGETLTVSPGLKPTVLKR